MGSGSSEDDDVAAWKAEAEEKDLLVAAELFFLARPEERVPWRCLVDGTDERVPWLRSSSPPRWGKRRPRSRGAAGKEEKEVVSWSPTTPLSWSGGSASSSGGNKGKRRRVDGSGVGDGDGASPVAVGGSVAKAMEVRTDVRSPGAAKRRQGRRKMTLGELKDFERSLLDERRGLQKELEEHRFSHGLLLEENARLRILKAKFQLSSVPRPDEACTVAEAAEAKMDSKRCLPFDLNLALPEELDAAC